MKTSTRKAYIAASILFSASLSTANAHAEDLLDVYKLALTNDAQYLAATATYEAARIDLPLAKTGFRPSVTSSATLGKTRSGAAGPVTTSNSNQIGINLDLPLYNPTTSIGINQAELSVTNSDMQFQIAKDELTLRVANRYFDVLAARDSKEVAKLQKIAIKRQMDLASERLDVGLGTRTDLYDAKARFEQANADVIAADIQINNARQALIEIIGVVPESLAELMNDTPLDVPEPNQIKYWLNLAQVNNLQIQSADLELLIASHEIDRQRAARKPTVSLGASQSYVDGDRNEVSDGDYAVTSVGITVNFPIYLAGATTLRTQQAGFRFNAQERLVQQVKRQITSQTTSAFLSVTNGISQVQALEEAIRAGESALEAKEEGFSAGLTTNLDVLDAQRDLSRSRTDYLRAKYNYIISLLQLELATGGLGDEDIRYINEWLTESQTSALD